VLIYFIAVMHRLRKLDPDNQYLRNVELDDYDTKIREQGFENIITSLNTQPESASNVNLTKKEEEYTQGNNFIFGEEQKSSEEEDFTKRRRERLNKRKHVPMRETHENDMDR
jgi:hypothetical protein